MQDILRKSSFGQNGGGAEAGFACNVLSESDERPLNVLASYGVAALMIALATASYGPFTSALSVAV